MNNHIKSFGDTASSLARNPLGIIALFIVLVYGIASIVTAFAASLTAQERTPLIYFLVAFPVLVLGVFAWLVSNHSGKLYSPDQFENTESFLKAQTQRETAQMIAVASLTAANAKREATTSETELNKIVETVHAAGSSRISSTDGWRNHVLWVDDRPENNTYERQAFEAMGLRFTLVMSTNEAFETLSHTKYAAIISDMGRREGPREGYVLLDRLRKEGDNTPLFFYAASNAPEHKRETRDHGGQGCTNNGQELFEMVTRAVIKRQTE